MTQTLLRAPAPAVDHVANIMGLRALASDEVLYVLDVNQWIAAFKKSVGLLDTCRVSTKASTRVLEYALRGRKTSRGTRVVIGSSANIVKTFLHTIETDRDPKISALAPKAHEWMKVAMISLKKRNVLFFDTVLYSRDELELLAKGPNGMPDWEDQSVYQALEDLRAAAIVGLDTKFMECTRSNNRCWITPGDILTVMAA